MDMHEARGARAYGDEFGRCFGLAKPKTHIDRSLSRGPFAVTELRSDRAMAEPSRPIAYDEAYLIGFMAADVPDHELWQDGRPAPTPPFRAGETALYDLRRDPISYVRGGHHSIHFYLPRAALVELAGKAGLRFDGELDFRFAVGHDDPAIGHLVAVLRPALDAGGAANGLLIDHLLHAVAAHVLVRYGGVAGRPAWQARGGLAPVQLRRAQEMMRAALAEDLPLARLAAACGLSAPHFARAFRRSTDVSPHRWLQQRRIDLAKTLLASGDTPLSEIALECGFADQSHFSHVFRREAGTSPGRWRRGRQG